MVGFAYRFPKWNIPWDYSYSFYIYHMIVINLMIHLGLVGNILYIPLALALSAGIAVASQQLIQWLRKGK